MRIWLFLLKMRSINIKYYYYYKEENKLPPNATIQETDLWLLTPENVVLHSAAEFLSERKSSLFWRRQK